MRKELGLSIKSCHDKLDEQKAVMENLQLQLVSCIQEQDFLKGKVASLEKENCKLKEQFRYLEQDTKSNSIVIHGIPLPEKTEDEPSAEENVVETVRSVGQALNFKFKQLSIDTCYRVSQEQKTLSGKPPPIVLKFTSRLEKQEFIRLKKLRSHLTTANIKGFEGHEENPVFITEDLTKSNRMLLSKAKKYGKMKRYQYVWWSNGKVLMRRKAGSRVLVVSSENDLQFESDEASEIDDESLVNANDPQLNSSANSEQ